MRFLPYPPFKCQHSLSLWPWLSALCTCTAFQLDLTSPDFSYYSPLTMLSISLNSFQSIKDMAEEVGQILHMLQKHFIVFKVIHKFNPLLGWSTKPPMQQSQPESINSLPILRPSLLQESSCLRQKLGVTLHSMTANCQQSASLSFTPYTFSLHPHQHSSPGPLPHSQKHLSTHSIIHSFIHHIN